MAQMEGIVDGDRAPLNNFLLNCKLKQEQRDEVQTILSDNDVTLDDVMLFSEQVLTETFKECKIKMHYIGRIIAHLKTLNKSGVCQAEPIEKVYLSMEGYNTFEELGKVHKRISNGVHNVQSAIIKLKENKTNSLKAINDLFETIFEELKRGQIELQNKVQSIAKYKHDVLKEELEPMIKYRNALQHAKRTYDSTFADESLSLNERNSKGVEIIQNAIHSDLKCDTKHIEPVLSVKYDRNISRSFVMIQNLKNDVFVIGEKSTMNWETIVSKLPGTNEEKHCFFNIKDDDFKKDDKRSVKAYILNSMPCASDGPIQSIESTKLPNRVDVGQIKFGGICNYKLSRWTVMGNTTFDINSKNNKIIKFVWRIDFTNLPNNHWVYIGMMNGKSRRDHGSKCLYCNQKTNCAIGISTGDPLIHYYDLKQSGYLKASNTISSHDSFAFVTDLKQKTVELYHNGKSQGIVFRNIYKSFIPCVSVHRNCVTVAKSAVMGLVGVATYGVSLAAGALIDKATGGPCEFSAMYFTIY